MQGGHHYGFHTSSATHVDADLLMEELALSADRLTHGLVGAAHALSKHESHALEQLRHDGTRVVPVFVISLVHAPEDLKFEGREMVAASHDAVVVLQLRQRCAAVVVVVARWLCVCVCGLCSYGAVCAFWRGLWVGRPKP